MADTALALQSLWDSGYWVLNNFTSANILDYVRPGVCRGILRNQDQLPRRAGTRIKTDQRDCVALAECSRAGQLRTVWVPDQADEAMRHLARAREDAVHMRTQQRQQIKSFLLRHGVRYSGKSASTKTFGRWLVTLNFGGAPAQTALAEYCQAAHAADERVQRLSR